MKTAVVLLSFTLVFLAVLQESSARYPGGVEIKGKQSKSSSDIESCTAEEKQATERVGGVSYETGSKKNQYSQDHDTASASEKEETVDDGCGHSKKVRSKSRKSSSVDVDGESSSSYKKIKY